MFAFVCHGHVSSDGIAARLRGTFDPFQSFRSKTHNSAEHFAIWGKVASAPDAAPSDSHYCRDDGTVALFDGWFDNRREIAELLDRPAETPNAELYAHAVERWGDEADLKIVGHYASIVRQPNGYVRMARSPITGRPLHWATIDGALVAASTPRLLASAGLPVKLSQQALADSMYLNLTDPQGWLEGSWRLGAGQLMHLSPNQHASSPKTYWKPGSIPLAQNGSDKDYIQQTEQFLQTSIRTCLADAKAPGVLLSGGLDSSNVAARATRLLGPDQALPSFTFVPSKVWSGEEPHWGYGDETQRVQDFAAAHPAITPHFAANEDRDFDSDWDKVFAAIGCAPPGLTNIWMYHGLYGAAKTAGCDRLLSAEYGNQSFSISADWAVAEYVRQGKWREAWRLVGGNNVAITPRWRRFLRSGFAANLPDGLWRLWQAIKGHRPESPNHQIAALNADAAKRHNVAGRADAARLISDRNFPATRQEWIRDIFARGDMGSGEIELAFEQIYGVSTRDPAAYRPLVEHCLSLPTEIYARGGISRWLGREMSRGHLPDAQRLEQKAGMHQADWHAKMTPEIPRIRAELLAASQRPELCGLFDFDELLARLDDWPETEAFNNETTYRLTMGIPIALMTARFIRHTYGWNE